MLQQVNILKNNNNSNNEDIFISEGNKNIFRNYQEKKIKGIKSAK